MISRKLLAAGLVHVLTLVVAYVVAREGVHLSATVAAQVSWAVAIAAGALAGWLAKEVPGLASGGPESHAAGPASPKPAPGNTPSPESLPEPHVAA